MVALGLAFVIQSAVAKPYEIPTGSMIPTIEEHDRVIANRLIYRFRDIRRGDIIVFQPTTAAITTCGQPAGNVPFVKRVVGLPGDVVRIEDSDITIVNGRRVTWEGPHRDPDKPQYTMRFAAVPADHVLVLGDNRDNSCDSHQWDAGQSDPARDPFVPMKNVIGQAEVTYWPINRMGFLN